MRRRRLGGLLFLALAGILVWGGTIDPQKATARWIVVAALAIWGLLLLFDRMPLRARDRIERVYAQIIGMGLAIAGVGWLVPDSGSNGLVGLGLVLIMLPLGLWLWNWRQRRTRDDDPNRPR